MMRQTTHIARRKQRGNVFAMLFGAVALTGVLASVGMQTLTGPVTTITRVTQRNVAETNLLMNTKIIVNAAVTGISGGDADSDGLIEPAAFVAAGGAGAPTNGGFLPTNLGLSQTDPWGTRFGYCVWDHGSTNSSTGRITGDSTAGASVQTVIAVVAAGPDKTFQTTCSAYSGGTVDAIKASGADDMIFKYTYAEATASSNGLWSINTSDDTKAELKDSTGSTVNVSIDRDTGIGDFLGVMTSTIAAKVDIVAMDGGLKLDTNASVTDCAVIGDAGVVRYNTGVGKMEVCNGTAWVPAGGADPAGSDGSLQFKNGTDLAADAANLHWDDGNDRLGIGTNSPAQTLDVTGTAAISGDFIVNTDAISVDATNKRLGIGKASPAQALDVVGNAYVTGDLAINTNTLFVDSGDGEVGIGTATPAYDLDVVGTTDMGALGAIDTSAAVVHVTDGTANLYADGRAILSDTAFLIGTSEAVAFQIVTDEAARVTVAADGAVSIAGNTNVGGTLGVTGAATLSNTLSVTGDAIFDTTTLFVDAATDAVGVGTTSPAAKLEVTGGVKIGADAVCNITKVGMIAWNTSKLQICDGTNFQSISAIEKLDDVGDVDASSPTDNQVISWDNASSTWKPKSITALGNANANPGGSDKQVQFNDGGSTLAGATQLIWDKANNRIGIGAATNPSQTLDVTGTAAVSGDTTIGGTLGVTGNATFDTTTLFVDAANDAVGIGTTSPLAKLDVSGAIKLSTQATCAGGGANNGTIRYDGSDLQMCEDGAWTSFSTGAAGGIAGQVPDAIDCGVSGNRRLLYLQTTTATHYYYQLISGAAGIGMQVAYDASDGSHDATINTAQWSNATGCDTKSLATLDSEGRAYYLLDGSGVVGAGGAPADAKYIIQQPKAELTNAQALSVLPSGIVKVTNATGILSSGAVDLSGAEATGILAAGRFPALTGDLTNSAGSLSVSIANDSVTFAKMQNINSDKILGRAAVGSGNVEEIGLGTGLSFSGGNLNVTETDPEVGTLTNTKWCSTDGSVVNCTEDAPSSASSAGADGSVQFSDGSNGFNADGTKFFWDNTNKRLGIGTAAPAAPLDVSLDIYANSTGTASKGLFVGPVGNAGAFLYLPSGDAEISPRNGKSLLFASSPTGTELMRIAASGNVGIGDTGPNAKLVVAGGARIGADATCTVAKAGMLAWNGNALQVCLSSGSFSTISSSTGAVTAAGNDTEIQFNDGGTTIGADADFAWDKTNNVLSVNGDVKASNFRTYGLTRTLPTTVDDVVEIGSIALSNGGGVLHVDVATTTAGFGVGKSYIIPINYDESNAWSIAQPIGDGGVHAGDNYELDVQVAAHVASLRLRRTAGSTAGTAYVSIKHVGNNANVFTASTATSSVTAPTTFYNATQIRQVDGNVGIGTTNPSNKLHVVGGATVQSPLLKATLDNYDNDSTTSFNISGATNSDTRLLSLHASGSGTQGSALSGAIFDVYAHNGTNFILGLSVNNNGKVSMRELCDEAGANCKDISSGWGGGSASGASGSVQFSDGTNLTSDNANLFWDDANNRLGIGTAGPIAKLHIDDNTGTITDEGDYAIKINNGTDTGMVLGVNSAGSAGIIQTVDVGTSWSTENLALQPNGGNVGIGTTDPKSLLDLGVSYSDPGTYPNKITLWNNGANDYFGFGISTGDLDYFSQANHRFYTEYNGTAGTEKMAILANGNVGIGTATPAGSLDVYSDSGHRLLTHPQHTFLTGPATGNVHIVNNSYFDGASWYPYDAAQPQAAVWLGSGAISLNTGAASPTGWNMTTRLHVNNAGNVGIGTSSPSHLLDVAGWPIFGIPAYTYMYLRDDDSTNGVKSIHANSNVVGFLNGSGGWMSYLNNSGSWNPLSDVRLKTNIRTLTNALDKVTKMRGVSYNWIDPERGTDINIGVISQEVESVYPELVDTNSDGFKHVTYDRLGPILLEAIKELKTQNDILRTEFETYKATHP